MSKYKVITLGTPTSTGGKVISASSDMTFPPVLVGDLATCNCGDKKCNKQGQIVKGTVRDFKINGIEPAIEGDRVLTTCGKCFLLSSGHNVGLGEIMGQSITIGGNGKGVSLGNGVSFKVAHTPYAQSQNVSSGVNTSNSSLNKLLGTNLLKDKEDERTSDSEEWKPVQGNFPILVYETQKKMDNFDAPDMVHRDENKEVIENYGFMKPFKQSEYYSHREGYTLKNEDQFSLPASEHFKRMRSLGTFFSNPTIGDLMGFKTSSIFSEMVDKFERNEGGYYSNQLLTDALKNNETTASFHEALLSCLGENINSGTLSNHIVDISSFYLGKHGKRPSDLPKFNTSAETLANGTVLAVHDVWSVRVYAESLEFKGSQVRGTFRYEVQDHFGLDVKDIDHEMREPHHWYEKIEGFRSWYLLQHFKGYGYAPFITQMDFTL
ncbi:PAAR domain-containing protein [Vibrio parahaemolyticus]|nr:PAAR domain-containing protein [Vibrio parahaemolyticus]